MDNIKRFKKSMNVEQEHKNRLKPEISCFSGLTFSMNNSTYLILLLERLKEKESA